MRFTITTDDVINEVDADLVRSPANCSTGTIGATGEWRHPSNWLSPTTAPSIAAALVVESCNALLKLNRGALHKNGEGVYDLAVHYCNPLQNVLDSIPDGNQAHLT